MNITLIRNEAELAFLGEHMRSVALKEGQLHEGIEGAKDRKELDEIVEKILRSGKKPLSSAFIKFEETIISLTLSLDHFELEDYPRPRWHLSMCAQNLEAASPKEVPFRVTDELADRLCKAIIGNNPTEFPCQSVAIPCIRDFVCSPSLF